MMPTYLDTHDLGNMTEEQIKQAHNAPMDEFGVTHKNMLYNKEVNILYCFQTHLTRKRYKSITKNLA